MCIKNKNYMENWLFWGLNLGNLKQCMMIMLVLTSSSSAWTLCSLLHISSLINICNFYSFWATGMVLTSKWGRILQEIHCQCQIWLNCPAAGRRPANFHKRNYLLSVNTTDFEKTTIQAHSAVRTTTSTSRPRTPRYPSPTPPIPMPWPRGLWTGDQGCNHYYPDDYNDDDMARSGFSEDQSSFLPRGQSCREKRDIKGATKR